MRKTRIVLFGLFFCSGASCLIFEVVWTRQLTVILGNTVFAVSTVLTAFMGGLALGSYLGGRVIDRAKHPLRVYALLEVGIGVSGFLLTLLLNQTGPVYVGLHRGLAAHPLLLYATRYVFSFCMLAVPTTLMGATLPVLSKFVARRQSALALDVGSLYALNTFGAASGCYLAGFLLIGNVGIEGSVRLAAALSIAVGTAAWLCQKRLGEGPSSRRSPSVDSVGADERAHRPLRWLVLVAFAVSGFAALGYEVAWTRLLTPFLGNSVYAFSAMLTAFLSGTALGSLCLSGCADRRKRLVAGLGLIEAAIGFYVLLSVCLLGWFAESLTRFVQPNPAWQGTAVRFLEAFALLLLPTFLMGAAFPVAGRAYIASLRRLGRSLGELYAWNTTGAIFGAAFAGFALMPALGLQDSLVVLACMNLCVAVVLCAAEPALPPRRRLILSAALVVAAGVGLALMPRDAFRRMHQALAGDWQLVYLEEDLPGTVAIREKGPDRVLLIDNLPVAGTDEGFLSSGKSLGHLPLLLHPHPQNVYVLGFGGGGTTYAISTHPEVRRIDATELSRCVVDVAGLFRDVNRDVTSDARVHLEVNDGRHFLLTSRRTYDVISVDLLWPQTAGSGSLYTRQFYELCHRRLSEEGILIEWLHQGFIPTQYVKIILRTVGHVFPHVSLWWAPRQEHLLVVASKAPLRIDFERLERRMNQPAVRRDLATVHLDDPVTLLGHFIACDEAVTKFVAGDDSLNSDDLPLLEYGLPRHSRYSALDNMEAMARIQQSVLPRLVRVSDRQKQRILACQRSNALLYEAILAQGDPHVTIAKCRQALLVYPENHAAQHVLDQIDSLLRDSPQ